MQSNENPLRQELCAKASLHGFPRAYCRTSAHARRDFHKVRLPSLSTASPVNRRRSSDITELELNFGLIFGPCGLRRARNLPSLKPLSLFQWC